MALPRILLTLTALLIAVLPQVVDWTPTHIFHPDWPGHARFHLVQLLMVNSALGVYALWILWGPGELTPARVQRAGFLQVIVLGAFFLSMALRGFSGATMTDRAGGVSQLAGGVDPNTALFSVLFAVVLFALWRARGAAAREEF